MVKYGNIVVIKLVLTTTLLLAE